MNRSKKCIGHDEHSFLQGNVIAMSFFSTVQNTFYRSFEQVRETDDPRYRKEKEELNQVRMVVGGFALAALVTSVAFSIFGIAACLGGSLFTGAFLLFLSLPVVYLSHNVHKVCENMKDIVDTPMKYKSFSTGMWDAPSIRTQLKRDTLCFEPFIDIALEAMKKAKR